MAKKKLCSTCGSRRATVLRSFSGFHGAFFMCDICDAPPDHAIRAIRREEDMQRRKCDTCEVRTATVVRSFLGFAGTFYVCDRCETTPSWAIRREVTG